MLGCVACGGSTSSHQASAFVAPPQAGIRPNAAALSPKASVSVARGARVAEPRRSRKPRSYDSSSCLRAEGAHTGNSPLSATSKRGLVFPTEIEDGWFDSATVGSPRVHRCKDFAYVSKVGSSKVPHGKLALSLGLGSCKLGRWEYSSSIGYTAALWQFLVFFTRGNMLTLNKGL